jgi:hypothetical protein
MAYTLDNIQGIETLSGLKRVNSLLGFHFFEPDSMRFFNSRISSRIYPISQREGYFVTSEQHRPVYANPEPRLYTVRKYAVTAEPDGYATMRIDTAGDFQAYESSAAAHRAAKSLVASLSLVS